jgi:hypothetical protein
MYRLSNDELKLLAALESIDSISIRAFGDEVYLHRRKSIGIYVSGHGVVLEPMYEEIQRFDDFLKVGVRSENRSILYGGYSIEKRQFIIPPIYSIHEFWKQYNELRALSTNPPS